MDIKNYFRWLVSYKFGLCHFECIYRDNCKVPLVPCRFCDNRIFDMCGVCVNRPVCGWPRRQKYSRDDLWDSL